jgi:protein gp37
MGDDTEERFKNFHPMWVPSSFHKRFPKKPSRIFVNSMSDIWYWNPMWKERRPDWMGPVLDRIQEYPQHAFLFLTKFPETYSYYDFPPNCWLGVSCPGRPTEEMVKWAMTCKNPHFVSIEPLMEEPYTDWLEFMGWVIVGGLTPKPVHEWPWVYKIIEKCKEEKIPLFLKNNIHYGAKFFREFPERI